jgi:hypothetical protein
MKIKFNKYMVRNNLFTNSIWFMLFGAVFGGATVQLFFFPSICNIEYFIGMLIVNLGLYINGFVSFK